MDFNDKFFEDLGRDPKVMAECKTPADAVCAAAVASAPVDKGDYKASFHVEIQRRGRRNAAVVITDDPEALIIESKTGNLARALNQVKKSG